MIYIEDNCLPKEQFEALRDAIPKRYVPFMEEARKEKRGGTEYESIRLTWHNKAAKWREGCDYLGSASVPGLEKILDTFKKLEITPENYSVWYSYTFTGMGVVPHKDSRLRNSSEEHTYTALIYTTEWKKEWGGELIFGKSRQRDPAVDPADGYSLVIDPETVVEPIPNRLIVFSRDQWHYVTTVTHPDPNFCRCVLGSGWSSVNDPVVYKMPS